MVPFISLPFWMIKFGVDLLTYWKMEVAYILKFFVNIVSTQFHKTIKAIRSDNETEFVCL